MKKRALVIIKTCFVSLFTLTMQNTFFSYAADSLDSAPELNMLASVFARALNAALIAAGAIFVAMIAYGVWKSSMSLGDPRGLEGAKQTWTYAVYGVLVIALFFSIVLIAGNIFGITSISSPGAVIQNAFEAIQSLISQPNTR